MQWVLKVQSRLGRFVFAAGIVGGVIFISIGIYVAHNFMGEYNHA